MSRFEALLAGWVISALGVMFGAKLAGSDDSILIAGMYGLVSAKGSAVARRYEVGGPYESWSIRTAFMVPFFPLSLIPLICGCVIVVYDWKADAPWVHYGCMALAFSAAVISYLLFAKLAGWPLRNSRPDKAPEHNALTRE